MPFDLVDGEGNVLQRQRHLLSLRDMNRLDDLEALLDAGVTSLKIEGRLKDAAYVKNVVSSYRRRLDQIMQRRPDDYRRSSFGHEHIAFAPDVRKSFNRLFTNYFLYGRTKEMANLCSPKSMGEPVTAETQLHNGDGLCYVDENGRLKGFAINRPEDLASQRLPVGCRLYRNRDQQMEQLLSKPTATRKVNVSWALKDVPEGFALRLRREDGASVERTFSWPHEPSRTSQKEQVKRQLSRLGDTAYEATEVTVDTTEEWFVPSSVLAAWRRALVDELGRVPFLGSSPAVVENSMERLHAEGLPSRLDYRGNVANNTARAFWLAQGAKQVDWALEVDSQSAGPKLQLMTCRYCIRHELNMCLKEKSDHRQLYLRLADGRRFRLQFDCSKCQMSVYEA